MKLSTLAAPEYLKWEASLDAGDLRRVQARLAIIREAGHFGLVNRFEGITELKWANGLRVYTYVAHPNVVLLLGGNKRGQEKDIQRAKKILSRYRTS